MFDLRSDKSFVSFHFLLIFVIDEKQILIVLLLLLSCHWGWAQHTSAPIAYLTKTRDSRCYATDAAQSCRDLSFGDKVVWFSAGHHHHNYDDYLSSLLYKGDALVLGFEQSRFIRHNILVYPIMRVPRCMRILTRIQPKCYHVRSFVRGFYGAHYHFNLSHGFLLRAGSIHQY